MATLDDLQKRIHDLINQAGQQVVSNPVTQNFLHSPVAAGIENAQRFVENPQSLRVNFADKIQNPVLRFAASIPQTYANIPHDVIGAGAQIGKDVRTGDIRKPNIMISDYARAAMPVLNLATIGGAGSLVKAGATQTLKNAVIQGAKTGATAGGAFSALNSLQNDRNSPVPQQAFNAVKSAVPGAIGGGIVGGGLSAAGYGASKVFARIAQKAQAQDLSPEQYLLEKMHQVGIKGLDPDEQDAIMHMNAGMIQQLNQKNNGLDLLAKYDDASHNQDKQGMQAIAQQIVEQPKGSPYDPYKDQFAKLTTPPPQEQMQQAFLKQPTKKEDQAILDFETLLKDQSPSTTIPSDLATQQRAEGSTLIGNEGKGGVEGFDPETKQAFQDWVNTRRATKVEGLLKKQDFQALDSKGINGLFEFQSGNKSGDYAPVKEYFDNKYDELQKAGINFNYKQDYLPQLWNNSPEEVQQVFGRSLGTKPSFTLESIIKNYQEGINAGLTPKFQNISDLAGWYEQRANKALADKSFFDYLGTGGFIQSSGKAPQGWVTLDPDRFPKISVNIDGGDKQYAGVYKAPPELADSINNYLRNPQSDLLNNIANYVSRAKNVTLSFGVPNTGINAHGFNILARHTLFGTGGNPITRFLTGAKYMVHPGAASNFLDQELESAPEAVKNGLTLSTEDHTAFNNEAESVATSLGKNWNNIFEKPLFNKMIPALKLSSYEELTNNGMDGKNAALMVNNTYGGINWEQMGRNRDTQNLLRSIVLAPDWAESNLRLGGNLAKSLTPFASAETANRYRTMVATLVGSIITTNIVNKITSGHFMYENEPGHTMEVQAGYTQDGDKRYIRPFGTGVDFVRLPYDIALGLAKGDPTTAFRTISNRLSIPLSSAMHLLTNVDYKGQAIYGRDKYGNDLTPAQSAGGIGSEALGLVGFPSFAKNTIDVATGRQGGEQGLLQALELPVRYQSAGNSKTQKFVSDTIGGSGESLYNLKKSIQGQAPFSENQKALIQDQGQSGLNDILEMRKLKKEMSGVKKTTQGQKTTQGRSKTSKGSATIKKAPSTKKSGTITIKRLTPPRARISTRKLSHRKFPTVKISKPPNSKGISQGFMKVRIAPPSQKISYKVTRPHLLGLQHGVKIV